MASISLNSVTKIYGEFTAMKDLDLEIKDGEFVALVGPSGCGKSTLLRLIAGLEEVTGGDLYIDGVLVNDLTPRERNIAMVFQSYALYPHMTVRENMAFSLKLSGKSSREQQSSVDEAARILDIDTLLDRKPAQLSGGQRQRVAMGRAVVRRPSVFLFDEPLSNLDAKLRVQMRSEIKSLHQKVRGTSVYVTHDQIEAMTLADRIVVLNKGVIEQQGSPLDLYLRPTNVFVAGFIGSPSMNFFPATVTDGNTTKLADGQQLSLPADLPVKPGQAVLLGVRPEDIELNAVSGIEGTISLVEPTGAQTHLIAELGGIHATIVANGIKAVKTGDTIKVGVSPKLLHVFDRGSELRLSGQSSGMA